MNNSSDIIPREKEKKNSSEIIFQIDVPSLDMWRGTFEDLVIALNSNIPTTHNDAFKENCFPHDINERWQ